jgi:ribosomal protein S18 acetylase RimI-like enzyme
MNTIRRLNVGEAQIYRDIRLESLRESPFAFATSYESALSRDIDSWEAQADASAVGPDRAIFIAFSDSPVGLVGLYRDQNDNSCGELLQMWVSLCHRGSSLAGDLMDHVFDWASQHEYRFIRAEVTENNLRALRFYEKYGFQTVASEGIGTTLTKEVEQEGGGSSPALRASP